MRISGAHGTNHGASLPSTPPSTAVAGFTRECDQMDVIWNVLPSSSYPISTAITSTPQTPWSVSTQPAFDTDTHPACLGYAPAQQSAKSAPSTSILDLEALLAAFGGVDAMDFEIRAGGVGSGGVEVGAGGLMGLDLEPMTTGAPWPFDPALGMFDAGMAGLAGDSLGTAYDFSATGAVGCGFVNFGAAGGNGVLFSVNGGAGGGIETPTSSLGPVVAVGGSNGGNVAGSLVFGSGTGFGVGAVAGGGSVGNAPFESCFDMDDVELTLLLAGLGGGESGAAVEGGAVGAAEGAAVGAEAPSEGDAATLDAALRLADLGFAIPITPTREEVEGQDEFNVAEFLASLGFDGEVQAGTMG
ncbi:hypothetical protein HK102_004916, partial [Quaeritorhiza haematococci]